jgi:hypothetical protein
MSQFEPQVEAESTDSDKLGDMEYPPDRPLGVEEYGVTGAEQKTPEPLEDRVAREEPEAHPTSTEADPPVEGLVAPDEELGRDVTGEEVATEATSTTAPMGEDLPQELEGTTAAEEDAVHVTPEPPAPGQPG